jgi:hypothetical protein
MFRDAAYQLRWSCKTTFCNWLVFYILGLRAFVPAAKHLILGGTDLVEIQTVAWPRIVFNLIDAAADALDLAKIPFPRTLQTDEQIALRPDVL